MQRASKNVALNLNVVNEKLQAREECTPDAGFSYSDDSTPYRSPSPQTQLHQWRTEALQLNKMLEELDPAVNYRQTIEDI